MGNTTQPSGEYKSNDDNLENEPNDDEKDLLPLPAWENLWDWYLKKHYERNRHHPEHFDDPQLEMTREDRLEMTCDLLGSVMGHALKNDVYSFGLEDCRALIETQVWRHWQKWVYEGFSRLPPASSTVPILPPRWRVFPEEEKVVLKECYERLIRSSKNNNNYNEVRKEIERELLGEDGKTPRLPCIAYYMRDLYFHKLGVERVWRMMIPPAGGSSSVDKSMESRIQSHDRDKYEIEMIIGYTQKWCF